MNRNQILELVELGQVFDCQVIPSGTHEGKYWLVFRREAADSEVLESDWVLAYAGKKSICLEKEFDSEAEALSVARAFGIPVSGGSSTPAQSRLPGGTTPEENGNRPRDPLPPAD